MRIGQKWAMMIGQERKSYYWTTTSCSRCGQVEVVEWRQLASVWVTYLLRYDIYIENVRVIGPSGHTLFAIEPYTVKSTSDQLFSVNMLIVAQTKRLMGNHKIAAKQDNSHVE